MSDVDVLIQARLQGEAAFAAAIAAMKALQVTDEQLSDALKAYNRAVEEGIPLQAQLTALQDFGIPTNIALVSVTKELTDAIKDQAEATEKLDLQRGQATTYGAALTAQELAYANAQLASIAAARRSTSAGAAGIPVWAGVVAAIAAATAILWPFVTVVASAAVVLTSFVVAGAGFLAFAGLIAGGFAAIAGAVLLLGGSGATGAADALAKALTRLQNAQETLVEFDQAHAGKLTILQAQQREQDVENVTNAQNAYNAALAASQGPVAVLLSQLSHMKDALAAQAAPLATLITQWLSQYIPAVQAAGSAILTWFGGHLPVVLEDMSNLISDLTPDFKALVSYIEQALGGAYGDTTYTLFSELKLFIRYEVIPAIEGLVTNLVRLENWFVTNQPQLGAIVQQIFGQLGSWIQWVASHWADLTHFAATQWPVTVKNVQDTLKQLNDWWKQNGDTIKTFAGNVVTLMGDFNSILGVWTKVYNFLNAVGLTPTAFLDVVNPIINALETAAGWAERLWSAIQHILASRGGGGWVGSALGGMNFLPAATGFSGLVTQPTLFLAGEAGPESVNIGAAAGAAAGLTLHVHIGSFYSDGPSLDRLTMAIAQRLSYVTGR